MPATPPAAPSSPPRARRFLPFEDARTYARSLGLKGRRAWVAWCQSGARPAGVPAAPGYTYKDTGWAGWGDWLGTGNRGSQNYNFLPFVQARSYAHSLNLKSGRAWVAWCQSGARPADIPADPGYTYKDTGWAGWGDWLGAGYRGSGGAAFLPFAQARDAARALNLNSAAEWGAWCRSGVRPATIPANPWNAYKQQGWIGMGDWLGTGTVAPQNRRFLPFAQARAAARALHLRGRTEWVAWCRAGARPADIPARPNTVYTGAGWAGWGDWLGTDAVAAHRGFLPFAQARAAARALHLRSQKAWYAWARAGARPDTIPPYPHRAYTATGWVGWGDWLGTGTVAPQGRTFLPFEQARDVARRLELKSVTEWQPWASSGARPAGVPAAPDRIYKDTGWDGWDDWLRADGAGSPNTWTVAALRRFVASLGDHLVALTPAELYVLFQQNGLLTATQGSGARFARAVLGGALPPAELEKFATGAPSQLDALVAPAGDAADTAPASASEVDADADLDRVVVDGGAAAAADLPLVETAAALSALERVATSADAEAVAFLIASAVRKLWGHAFRDAPAAVAQAEAEAASANEYVRRAAGQFLDEYRAATALAIPAGYAFRGLDGQRSEPHLMQRLIASQVQTRRRVGNWSGTGAGKTLAAVLASRVIDAGLTVITCPNSVVDVWERTIRNAFPDSVVAGKTWDAPSDAEATGFEARAHRYLVLNYEMFQQPGSAQRVRRLVERERIDLLVVDEVQAVKQRDDTLLTQRRQHVAMLVSQAGLATPALGVLGMSATPVVNNLQEGKSLVELLTGLEHPELPTQPTISNCMKLHQQLVVLGIREKPDYATSVTPVTEQVELSDATVDEIRALGARPTVLELERLLTRERLPAILRAVKPGTLIYTELLDGIEKPLRDALVGAGFTVGAFTGDDKTGLQQFLAGDVDVLLGSSAIGTGVDGLQAVCDTLIFNVLPWTAAQYDQVTGRVYRQGQRRDVTVVRPVTFATVRGERWSWCDSKMDRVDFKRSIADAAVDGVVPVGHLRSPQQALADQLGWLKRLDEGAVETISRQPLRIPLPPADAAEDARRRVRYGDFSRMNQRINSAHSETTNARFRASPDEWVEYHSRYQEARRSWPVVPVEDLIRYYADERGLVIGDFGAGEAALASALGDRHTVHSFDHVAVDGRVTAGDMAHTPLPDASLDAAIFSLSLMGANFGDYLREAARVVKRDRVLQIYEATTRFGAGEAEVGANRQAFVRRLRDFGFDVVEVGDRWRFTYLKAIRSGRAPLADATIAFKQPAAPSREEAA